MTDTILTLVTEYGLWLIGITTFLSCIAVPVPASLMMIAGGAFAASGDLPLAGTVAAAYVGTVIGDQISFAIGRRGEHMFQRLQTGTSRHNILLKRAKEFSVKRGLMGVFLSRWLFCPLGPYVNFIAGATGIKWFTFTIAATAGEAIWITLYTGLGYTFSNQIDLVSDLSSNISALLVVALIAVLLGRYLFRAASKGTSDV